MIGVSFDGRWELRYVNRYSVNEAGYRTGSWHYELVERASGHVVRSWSGSSSQSPWNESRYGTSSVRWEGDVLVVVDEDGTEQRVAPGH